MSVSTTRRRLIAGALIASSALLLVGCAPRSEPGDGSVATDRPARSGAVVDPVPSVSVPSVVGEVPDDLLAQIVADAAERAGVDVEALDVIRAEAITWNDGSLGCPEPGMMYTQALVDGYHVIVVADGDELDYRATTSGTFRLCERSGPPSGG